MKLVFPHGEQAPVLLSPGVNRIGGSSDAMVVVDQPGLHCELHVTGAGVSLRVPPGAGPVKVNGKPVTELIALRSGDQLVLGTLTMKFVGVEESDGAASSPQSRRPRPAQEGATRVHVALPKYLLRGVSGAVFGRLFPVNGPVSIGRSGECDIALAADGISRRHALVKPTPEGLAVEDLGSSNGTYINGRRIQNGFLANGDELRLDTLRFIVVMPGADTAASRDAAPALRAVVAGEQVMSKWVPIMLTIAAVIVIVALVVMR